MIKKLKEKKWDGKALIGLTPEKVKEIIPEKHRPMFLVCGNNIEVDKIEILGDFLISLFFFDRDN